MVCAIIAELDIQLCPWVGLDLQALTHERAEATAAEGRGCCWSCGQEEEGHSRTVACAEGYVVLHDTILARGCTVCLSFEDCEELWLTRHTVDLSELSLGSTMKTTFPNPDDILNFTLSIEPDEGMYKGGRFNFSFAINQNFPHDPPKVKCKEKIYHPNIDLEGNVCLNILREDWKPVLNLNAVIVGLQVGHASSPSAQQSLTITCSSFFSNPTHLIHSTRMPPKTSRRIGKASSATFGPLWAVALSGARVLSVC